MIKKVTSQQSLNTFCESINPVTKASLTTISYTPFETPYGPSLHFLEYVLNQSKCCTISTAFNCK